MRLGVDFAMGPLTWQFNRNITGGPARQRSTSLQTAQSGWLGTANRDRPSEGVRRPIHVRALALQPSGTPPVLLIAVELVGLSRGTIDQILCGISERHRIDDDRVTINCSHTHSGPVTSGMLDLGFDLTVQQKQLINRYTEDFRRKGSRSCRLGARRSLSGIR